MKSKICKTLQEKSAERVSENEIESGSKSEVGWMDPLPVDSDEEDSKGAERRDPGDEVG